MPTIRDAAASGSRSKLLEAMRDQVAEQLDEGVAPRDLASLTKRLLEITEELEQARTDDEGDDVTNAAITPDEPWPAG